MSAPLGMDWLTTPTGRMTAAWWNIVVCAVLIVGSLVMGFTQHPFGLIVACLGVVMEFQFVRLLSGFDANCAELTLKLALSAQTKVEGAEVP